MKRIVFLLLLLSNTTLEESHRDSAKVNRSIALVHSEKPDKKTQEELMEKLYVHVLNNYTFGGF
jgi:hypothetical protein